MAIISREGVTRNDLTEENPDLEAEARGYAPSRLVCRSNRGTRFVTDLIPYLVEMISTSCKEPLEERLRCIRVYRTCTVLASVATQDTSSWHRIVANTSEIFRCILAKRDRCIEGMSRHWTSRIFRGLIVEHFNSFLRPTAYDREDEDEDTKQKKRFSKLKKLKKIGKSEREKRQRRGTVTGKLVRAGKQRAGKLVRRLSSPWISTSPPTFTDEDSTVDIEDSSFPKRRSIFGIQGKFVVPSPMRSIRKMRDSLLSTPLNSLRRKRPFSFDPKSTSKALRKARKEQEEEEERKRKRERRRQRRKSRRGSNVVGAVVRRDLCVSTESTILEEGCEDILARDRSDREEELVLMVESDREDERVLVAESDCEEEEKNREKEGKKHCEDEEKNHEEMELPPGLNYVKAEVSDDDEDDVIENRVRFKELDLHTRVEEKKKKEEEEPTLLFRKRNNTEVVKTKKQRSVLELFGNDDDDDDVRNTNLKSIKSRYNSSRSGVFRSQSQRKFMLSSPMSKTKINKMTSRSLALSALQPMIDVLGRSSSSTARPETSSSPSSQARYSRLEKLKDWKRGHVG